MSMKKNIPQLMEKWLKDLIRIDTQNPPGRTKEAVDYLLNVADELGGITSTVHSLDEDRHNIVWKIGDEHKKKIVLCGHLDTVPIGNLEFWDFDPFSSKKFDGDKIGGRGAADMKAGVVSILGTIAYLLEDADSLPWQIVFVGTADEEVSMAGARAVRDEVMKNAEFLFITEPTDGHVGIAEKGVLQLKAKFIGKAAHGSMPDLGINAILVMAEFLENILELPPDEVHPLLGKTTINIGRIQGGTKVNIVADTCWSEIDIRFIPNLNPKELQAKIKDLMTQLNNKHGCTSHLEIIHQLQALESSIRHPMISILRKEGAREPIGLTYATDAAELLSESFRNVPFVIFGPGNPNVIHKPNEWVSLEETITTAQILANAIKQYHA